MTDEERAAIAAAFQLEVIAAMLSDPNVPNTIEARRKAGVRHLMAKMGKPQPDEL